MGYEQEYSEASFWSKARKTAKKAGKKVIYSALLLYYTTRRPETPRWAKTAIYGALGYFISVIDFIPDVTPFVGYADDLGVLAIALSVCAAYVNEEVRQKAREKLYDWFGEEALTVEETLERSRK
ncbi:YkvA family protein [Propionispora hippei]|uniref:Uncharacterized membrane protein YkvA, DUF1232 family n=1 Tax=Propionispora hippei DSM 15287 TaxID=1123003 RepID=A0A1M6M401_9FIRM|nr:YkvA family protein [Propionispora hippei]SHJ78162.1 Uncharacterized membrane protein YkvA, DUF1232 family [Propionispora hippei DSM 15287]